MCITSQGKSIKLKVSTISIMGRGAMGVRILNIDKPDFVIGVDRVVQEDATLEGKEEAAEEVSVEETEVAESDEVDEGVTEEDAIDSEDVGDGEE
jgi:DNA gyrase subunit A